MSDLLWGFTVKKAKKSDDWAVYLPHQCDAWAIAGDADSYNVHQYEPHVESVAALESFIAEAQLALKKLKERQPDA